MIVSAIIGNEFRYAHTADEIDALIDEAFSGHFSYAVSRFYLSDRPCSNGDEDGNGHHYPGHALGLGTSDDGQFAALHFYATGVLVQSLNEPPLPDAPAVIYNTESDLYFPANAVIDQGTARIAVVEYCRTGTQPSSVDWQPCEII
ncbi:Imm1 family immunity protein [Allokutzneria albata]|uniref:Immunity protein Imm1 n=1 Tax=Allokutzneria albata TaxID=211114 RepID=A0A1G9YCK7_ALLAB|nr:Imm1 family immunity protein [Allokutzneria albata]SDN06305.1 Immunity protein Imm1 [Allokutzneria albata]